jgi:hypothetical protein
MTATTTLASDTKQSLERKTPDTAQLPAMPRPTPQTTLEAVMWAVRRRGLPALREPAYQQRLLNCDAAARAQINARIEKLLAAGRIPRGAIDA